MAWSDTKESRATYLADRKNKMPDCAIPGCNKKVSVIRTGLCLNHHQQTPEGRDQVLKNKYGLRPGEYDNLMRMQDGKCGICGASESINRNGSISRLSVDHDHKTNAVRGLLCNRCNTALGQFDDDPEKLTKAIIWLGMDNPAETRIIFKECNH